jgi:hypothetical protein
MMRGRRVTQCEGFTRRPPTPQKGGYPVPNRVTFLNGPNRDFPKRRRQLLRAMSRRSIIAHYERFWSRRLGESEFRPDLRQRLHQMLNVGVAVVRRRRDPQPFSAARNSWVVDRLDIDVMAIDQHIADMLAQHRIAP